MSPLDAGLALFPMAIGVAMFAQPAAKMYPKVGPRKMMMVGFLGAAALTFALVLIDYDTSSWWVAGNMFLRGVFFAFLIIPMQAATFATIRPEDTGRASSIFSVGRQVAASLGVAILATALTTRLAFHDAVLGSPATRDGALSAFHDAFIFAGFLSLLGVVAALLIDDDKAAKATEERLVAEEAMV